MVDVGEVVEAQVEIVRAHDVVPRGGEGLVMTLNG